MTDISGKKLASLLLTNTPKSFQISINTKQYDIELKEDSFKGILISDIPVGTVFLTLSVHLLETMFYCFEAQIEHNYHIVYDTYGELFNLIDTQSVDRNDEQPIGSIYETKYQEEGKPLWHCCTDYINTITLSHQPSFKSTTIDDNYFYFGLSNQVTYPFVPDVVRISKAYRTNEMQVSTEYIDILKRVGATNLKFDSSELVSYFLRFSFIDVDSFLSMFQVSFLLFLYGNCFNSMKFWSDVIHLLASSPTYLTTTGKIQTNFLLILIAQFKLGSFDKLTLQGDLFQDTNFRDSLMEFASLDSNFRIYLSSIGLV